MRALIFDMDGVMFDTERLYIDAWDYAGEKLGIGRAGYVGRQVVGMSYEGWSRRFRQEFGEDYDERGLLSCAQEFMRGYYEEHGVPIKKGLLGLLDFLRQRDFKLAVASSSMSGEVYHHLGDAGITDRFTVITAGDMVSECKPSPEIYLTACRRLAVAPEECYAVEDSRCGLESAHSAGCRVLFVPDLWPGDDEHGGMFEGQFADLDAVREYLDEVLSADSGDF